MVENNNTFKLKAVITNAEPLYDFQKKYIGKAFDCPVFDAYGGEGMPTANQCESGCYHILPSMIVNMESEGKNLDEGQPGRLLLTSLTNFAMPMIQYDIADLGIMGEGECSCGRNWKFLNNN